MQPPTQGGGRKRQNLTLDLNSASAKKNAATNTRRRKKTTKFNVRSKFCISEEKQSSKFVNLSGCSNVKINLS